jgi:ubiquitin-like protein 4
MPNLMSKRLHLAPGQERSVAVIVKSLRNPPLDIKLSSQPLGTSILDIKTAVSSQARIPVEKLKVLHNKKPVADSKVLKDLVGDDETTVDLSVMVLGGAAAVRPEDSSKPATAQGVSGAEVLNTEAFWDDLRGFLLQRIRNEQEAEALHQTFRKAWQVGR